MTLGDEVLCSHYGMRYGNTVLWHTPSINIKYFESSPLMILLYETALLCQKEKITCLDLGLGEEEYKVRFFNTERTIFNVLIPVTLRGKLIESIRLYAQPEKLKATLFTVRQSLKQLWYKALAKTTKVNWYESTAPFTFQQHDYTVSVIDDYKVFVDFCRCHNLPLKRDQYHRFKDGYFFVTLHDDSHVLSYGWGIHKDQFYLSEINQSVLIDGFLMLCDFHTPPQYQRKGYFTLLLNGLMARLPEEKIAIFANVKNQASNKGIVKAGFSPMSSSPALVSNDK